MYVIKRNGNKEAVSFDKVLKRITYLAEEFNLQNVDPALIAKETINGIYDGVFTSDLDKLAAEVSASRSSYHYEYSKLAACICVSSLHKSTPDSFYDCVERLYNYVHDKTNSKAALVSDELWEIVKRHGDKIEEIIEDEYDYQYDYFGYQTLERSYLLKIDKKPVETPQYMLMRVSLGIWSREILEGNTSYGLSEAFNTYEFFANKMFTHATPTLFNSGTPRPQLASCFLLDTDDSIEGILTTLQRSALISKNAGGIGIAFHKIRAEGAYIKGTNGYSNGIIPFLKMFNETAKAVDQGGGKRKGSFAIYMEPWHQEIFEFLDIRKNNGKEELRARDLFTAIWVNDLFLERVAENGEWSLFSPDEVPQLINAYDSRSSKDFTNIYTQLENTDKVKKRVKARDLFKAIYTSVLETGTPYIVSKDRSNEKSNQQNLGTIKSSNLCAEIIEYTDFNQTAVCNLASICLNSYLKKDYKKFRKRAILEGPEIYREVELSEFYDLKIFKSAISQLVRNLNEVIDYTMYVDDSMKNSNLSHRPIGIGVQGLADLFAELGIPFTSKEAKRIHDEIFENLYYFALEESNNQARYKGVYPSFNGSPASKGMLQFDLSQEVEVQFKGDGSLIKEANKPTTTLNWDPLKQKIMEDGLRNSLLIALMPTASTSQIMGNNECFEPFTSNLYVRRTLSGEFIITNKYLIDDLIDQGIWSKEVRDDIIYNDGSIQNLDYIPESIKEVYKTVYEIPNKELINMEASRGHFVCQSQSMNLYFENLKYNHFISSILYSWAKGNKTLLYYARTKPSSKPLKSLGISKSKESKNQEAFSSAEDYERYIKEQREKAMRDDCEMCSS